VVLFSLLGLGVQLLFRVDVALAAGVLLGFVVANFVPSDKACSARREEPRKGI
jgi:hypothetical protein